MIYYINKKNNFRVNLHTVIWDSNYCYWISNITRN